MPATHSLDVSPLHVGSLPNTPVHYFPALFLDQPNRPFQGHQNSYSCLLLARSVVV
jgi:hypothetical protein